MKDDSTIKGESDGQERQPWSLPAHDLRRYVCIIRCIISRRKNRGPNRDQGVHAVNAERLDHQPSKPTTGLEFSKEIHFVYCSHTHVWSDHRFFGMVVHVDPTNFSGFSYSAEGW